MMVVHLGVRGWQQAFTPVGLSPNTEQVCTPSPDIALPSQRCPSANLGVTRKSTGSVVFLRWRRSEDTTAVGSVRLRI